MRPSDLYAIDDPVPAFYFDRAVATLGAAIDRDITESTKDKQGAAADSARAMVLHRWLGTPMKFATPKATR